MDSVASDGSRVRTLNFRHYADGGKRCLHDDFRHLRFTFSASKELPNKFSVNDPSRSYCLWSGPFLDAWQRFSCHCASHLSSVFIYSLVASELNRSKRLTDQLLCEISLLIVVSLSVRRINMAEISEGSRVSVKHDCLKRVAVSFPFFRWTMGAAELFQSGQK